MGREDKAPWKSNYFLKLVALLEDYPKCFIVGADNVGSEQMQQIRISLRGSAVGLVEKNTMMRKAIKGHLERNPALEKILPHIKGNVGFMFTRDEFAVIRDKLLENKVRTPSHARSIAPLPVVIPAQNSCLGPEKTSFFQALYIPTKISISNYNHKQHILKPGDKVGASEATLLNMLNISPFSYGLVEGQVCDSGTMISLRFWTSNQKISSRHFWLEFKTWLLFLWLSTIQQLHLLLTVSPMGSRTFLTLLLLLMSSLRKLRLSRNTLRTQAPVAKKEEKKEESESEDDDMGFGLFD